MTDPEQIIKAETEAPTVEEIPGEHVVGGRPGYLVVVQLVDLETNQPVAMANNRTRGEDMVSPRYQDIVLDLARDVRRQAGLG